MTRKLRKESQNTEGKTSLPIHIDFFLLRNCSANVTMFVNHDMIDLARSANLYEYLWNYHPDLFKKTALNLYLKGNNSLVIHNGSYGYKDYATNETGNGIDFLTRYLGYSFLDATRALAENNLSQQSFNVVCSPAPLNSASRIIQLPPAARPPFSRLYAFLMKRRIPKWMINTLVDQGLLYQSDRTNNLVFVNPERDYFELRGTFTYADKPFHGCGKTRADRFWYLKGGNSCDTVYITEGAIDAISLFLLHKQQKDTSKTVYASIGGVSNNVAIERIRRYKYAILAVDNDEAGERCRQRYKDLESILPVHKDWNEDLILMEEAL